MPMPIQLNTIAKICIAVASFPGLGCGTEAPPPPSEPKPAHAENAMPNHAHAAHHHENGGHSHSDPLVHRFEKAEEWVAVFDDPARDAWQKPGDVISLLKLGEGMSVADIGAGTGYFLPHLSRAVGAKGLVLGLDIEPDMVRYMRERAQREHLDNVRAELVRPNDPQVLSQKVDRILIVDTWHHIPERGAYSAKLKQALKADGQVMIVDFTLESDKGPPKHHRIQPDQVIRELGEGGIKAECIGEPLPDQYVVVGKASP